MKKATFLFVGASLLMLACSDGPGSGAGTGLGSSGIPSNGSVPGPGTVPGGGPTGSNTGGSGNTGNTGGDGGSGNIGNSGGTGGGDCLSGCQSLATECGFDSGQCGAFCSQLTASQISCIQETGCAAITDPTNDPCGLFGGSGGTGGGTGGTGGGTGGGPSTCSTADECAGCTVCLDACYCQAELTGFDPTICPSSCGG